MCERELSIDVSSQRLIARCGCGGWQQERVIPPGRRLSAVVREVEIEFDKHARPQGFTRGVKDEGPVILPFGGGRHQEA